MPYKDISSASRHNRMDLVDRLIQEINNPQSADSPDVPSIVDEEQRFGGRHITVIWDAFSDVPPEHRGEIILDAYEKSKYADRMSSIRLAMGITRLEAPTLGIS